MTGMASYGEALKDDEIWNVVASSGSSPSLHKRNTSSWSRKCPNSRIMRYSLAERHCGIAVIVPLDSTGRAGR